MRSGADSWPVALIQIVAAVLLWRPGRHSFVPAGASVALFAAEVTQIGFGFSNRLAVHVPPGAAILLVTVLMLAGIRSNRTRR